MNDIDGSPNISKATFQVTPTLKRCLILTRGSLHLKAVELVESRAVFRAKRAASQDDDANTVIIIIGFYCKWLSRNYPVLKLFWDFKKVRLLNYVRCSRYI